MAHNHVYLICESKCLVEGIPKAQGSANVGKILKVDSNGNLVLVTPEAGSVSWGDIAGTLSNQTDLHNEFTKDRARIGELGNAIGMKGWNQLVSSSATSVTLTNGHKFFAKISGTESIVTGTGSAVSVTGGSDMVIDLTAIFGAGNEPTTVAEFRAMFPASYYPYCQGGFADLLWENASPSSAFAGQTVSIESISKYKYFGIIIRDNKDLPSLSTIQIILNKYSVTSYICYTNPTEGNSRRDVVVWSDAIVFGNCKKQTSTDNNWMIPYQIYGIR